MAKVIKTMNEWGLYIKTFCTLCNRLQASIINYFEYGSWLFTSTIDYFVLYNKLMNIVIDYEKHLIDFIKCCLLIFIFHNILQYNRLHKSRGRSCNKWLKGHSCKTHRCDRQNRLANGTLAPARSWERRVGDACSSGQKGEGWRIL